MKDIENQAGFGHERPVMTERAKSERKQESADRASVHALVRRCELCGRSDCNSLKGWACRNAPLQQESNDSTCPSDILILALRYLDDDGLEYLAAEVAKRIGGKLGNRGMCLRHHEWDRITISKMECTYCGDTADVEEFQFEPNAQSPPAH